MEDLDLNVNKFPFVIDSPRGNEASVLSSQEILKLIVNIDSIPQIIISTVDFESFRKDLNYTGNIEIALLTEKYKLLNKEMYEENITEINTMCELFADYIKE